MVFQLKILNFDALIFRYYFRETKMRVTFEVFGIKGQILKKISGQHNTLFRNKGLRRRQFYYTTIQRTCWFFVFLNDGKF